MDENVIINNNIVIFKVVNTKLSLIKEVFYGYNHYGHLS